MTKKCKDIDLLLSLQEKNEIDQDQEATVEEKIDSMEKGNI